MDQINLIEVSYKALYTLDITIAFKTKFSINISYFLTIIIERTKFTSILTVFEQVPLLSVVNRISNDYSTGY